MEEIKAFPDGSFDMIMTSPPYDDMRDYKGFSYDLHAVGVEIFRILKEGSVAVVVIQDATRNFGKTLTSFGMITDWCDNIGFKLFETVIYSRKGTEGAWWTKRFRVDHEYVPIFLKGKRPQYFNKENLKIPSKHAGKKFSGSTKRLPNGKTVKIREYVIKPTKCRGTIWEYADDGSRLKHKHPATFPNMMAYDFIECFCPTGGIVIDPYPSS